MNVVSKLLLTVVMLAIGAAPALSLHADTFLPGAGGPPARGPAPAAPSSPEADPVHHREDPPAEVAVPVVAIPQSEAEWAAWTALRVADGSTADQADAAGIVETPVGEPEQVGWTYDEPEDEPEVEPEASGIDADDDADDEADDDALAEDEAEGDGGLLGILG